MNPTSNSVNQEQVLELLRGAKNILIAPSTPDGDSIGSALALMLSLRKLGKEVTVVCTEEVPVYLRFLPFTNLIQKDLQKSKDFVISLSTADTEIDHLKYEVEDGKVNIIVTAKEGQFEPHHLSFEPGGLNFDLIITVDTGDLIQLGKLYENNKKLFQNGPLLNIDHHASNGKFGTHNYLSMEVSSTTQLLTPILKAFEQEFSQELIDEDVATLLLTGLITDTGSFQHSNTTPEAFEVAADLLERGANQQEIIRHIFKTKSLETLKLWGRVLSKIQYDPEIRLVYSIITQQDLADTGANSEDTGGIIDELMSNAPGAEVVMLLKEKEPGFVSGSFRAPGKLADVSEIAQTMNGGGHKKAAGFRIREKSMEEALQIAKNNVSNYMRSKLGTTPANPVAPAPITLTQEQEEGRLFPGLVVKPQTSIPKPAPGGEDLLLEDFRKQQASQDPSEQRVQEAATRFFQDADGQVKAEKTVGDVLEEMA